MDAYDLNQKIFYFWQQLSRNISGATVKKSWADVPVYVDNRRVIDVKIVDDHIELELEK